MKLIIEIDTDNAAFTAPNNGHMDNIMARGAECARILRVLSDEEGFLNNGYLSGQLRDLNGNMVGTYSFEDE